MLIPQSCNDRTPNGPRTRAAAVKGRCPRPLDDGGLLFIGPSGTEARTPTHRGKYCRTQLELKAPEYAAPGQHQPSRYTTLILHTSIALAATRRANCAYLL